VTLKHQQIPRIGHRGQSFRQANAVFGEGQHHRISAFIPRLEKTPVQRRKVLWQFLMGVQYFCAFGLVP
jgi:hypothetical protein